MEKNVKINIYFFFNIQNRQKTGKKKSVRQKLDRF